MADEYWWEWAGDIAAGAWNTPCVWTGGKTDTFRVLSLKRALTESQTYHLRTADLKSAAGVAKGPTYCVVLVQVVSLRRVVRAGRRAARLRWRLRRPLKAATPNEQIHVLQAADARLQLLRARLRALFLLLD